MFNHQAEAAMNFYVSVFKDAKIISTIPRPDGSVVGRAFEKRGPNFMEDAGFVSLKNSKPVQKVVSNGEYDDKKNIDVGSYDLGCLVYRCCPRKES